MFNLKFYKVGMISLLLIPAICIPYLKVEYKKRDFSLLKLNMPAPEYENKSGVHFNYYMLDKIRKEVVLKEFDGEDTQLESAIGEFSKLDSNQAFLEKIPVNYKYGLRIKLSNQTNYETFVKLLNLCSKYQLHRFVFDLRYDEMYIYDTFNIVYHDGMFPIINLGNCLVIEETGTPFLKEVADNFKVYITPAVKSFSKTIIVYIAFLGIVLIAFKREEKYKV